MRSRLPLILIALTIFFAFVAAGCGDDEPKSDSATSAGATQSTDVGATGASGSASASAQTMLDDCIKAAETLPDDVNSAKAKKRCQDSYDNVKEVSEKIDQAASDARAKCEESANQIPNEEAKASALEACAKFD